MYKLILSGAMVTVVVSFGLVTSASAKEVATTTVTTATTTPAAAITTATTTVLETPAEVEKRVREYFTDAPVMIEIAKCESKFRQFTDSGTVLRGGASGGMIGVFQFYESVHKTAAQALGFDLATLEGNIGYARHLYEQSGSTPWSSCVPAGMTQPDANTQLKIKLLTKVVELLTELLKMKLAEGR